MRRSIALPATALVVCFAVAQAQTKGSDDREAQPSSTDEPVIIVEETTIESTRTVFATLQGVDRTPARARISGLVRSLDVDEGAEVKADQVIGLVEDPELASRIRSARGVVDSAEAEFETAQAELRRIQELFEAGDASRSRLDEATRRFRSAQGALETARSDLETLQARQERGRILAPVSGLVLQVPVTLGAAVDRGELIAEVTADPPVLRLAAPERHADRLAEADEVQIETPGGLATARVVKVYPEIVQGRVEADIQLSEAMTTRFAGRRVGVRLTTGSRTSIVVPRRFLTRRHGLAYVYRETGGKTLVQTGHAWSDRVEVLSGLEPGDRLVLPSTTAAPT